MGRIKPKVKRVFSFRKKGPKSSPEAAARQYIAIFFDEFMPGVAGEYEALDSDAEVPKRISLLEYQFEVIYYSLHCLDRAVLVNWGNEYRIAFMDQALYETCCHFASVIPDIAIESFIQSFRDQYNTHQREYSLMTLPTNDNTLKGTLFWEYTKRIMLLFGVGHPYIIAPTIMKGAFNIFTMMCKGAELM
jgi:hypothetical protein